MEFRKAAIAVLVVAFVSLGNTAAQANGCPGDCDGDGEVSASEIVFAVRHSLEGVDSDLDCYDLDADGRVSVSELVTFVRSAISECGIVGSCSVDGRSILVGCPGRSGRDLTVAGGPSGFVVAYSQTVDALGSTGILARRFDRDMRAVDPAPVEISGEFPIEQLGRDDAVIERVYSFNPVAVGDPDGAFYVAWRSTAIAYRTFSFSAALGRSFGAREASLGQLDFFEGLWVIGYCAFALSDRISLAWDPDGSRPIVEVAYANRCGPMFRSSPQGWIIGDEPPAMARSATELAGAWIGQVSVFFDFAGSAGDSNGRLAEFVPLIDEVGVDREVDLAGNPDDELFLAVWSDRSESVLTAPNRIRGGRFTAAAGAVDPLGGFEIGSSLGSVRSPVAAGTADGFAIAWLEDVSGTTRLLVRRADALGELEPAHGQALYQGDLLHLDIAASGSAIAVGFAERESNEAVGIRVLRLPDGE